MFKIKNIPNYINFVEPLRSFDSIFRNRHNKRLHREAVQTGKVDDWNLLTQEAIDSTNKNLFRNRIEMKIIFSMAVQVKILCSFDTSNYWVKQHSIIIIIIQNLISPVAILFISCENDPVNS